MKTEFKVPALANTAMPQIGPDKPWLAPMAGYSDLPFRLLCAGQGAAVCETEMISAKGLCYGSAGTDALLENASPEAPLIVQLFGSGPEEMATAVKMLRNKGWLWFDCNMGCPAKKVIRQGSGSALLKDPAKALQIAQAMIKALKESSCDQQKPKIGFKLRAGFEMQQKVAPDLALRLQDAGADWITLHPRYGREGYTGSACWDEIAALKSLLDIPVIASGDLFTAEQGLACLKYTNADAVMYARGALRDPAIFGKHILLLQNGEYPVYTRSDLRNLIERHIILTRDWSGLAKAFYKIRSIIPRYVRHFPGVGELRNSLCHCTSWDALITALDNFMEDGR